MQKQSQGFRLSTSLRCGSHRLWQLGHPHRPFWLVMACLLSYAAHGSHTTHAGEPASGTDPIQEFRSTHFVLMTDLSPVEAKDCLKQMEQVLGLAEDYWSRDLPRQIRSYVVRDLDQWSHKCFPATNARLILRQVKGGTALGDAAESRRDSVQAVIYAMADVGVAEHEVVHAYCFQTFGVGGPDWYREGMAELFAQEAHRLTTGCIRPETVSRLHQGDGLTIRKVTQSGRLDDSVSKLLAQDTESRDPSASNTEQHWPTRQQNQLSRARTVNAESWALCHLLYHNRNYSQRFRVLGRHLLSGASVSLEQAFGGRGDQIDFELAQFADNLTTSYRADLCHWNWDHRVHDLEIGQSITIRLRARRGYQPAQVRLAEGQTYSVAATGTWHVTHEGDPIDADGNSTGSGCLEAAILNRFDLAKPIQLGKRSTLNAQQSGRLFLRCHDDWDQLSDNRGTIAVRLTRTH